MELTIIQQKIHEIRGHKVMLDFDLAALYDVQTKVFKQAVKRNLKRFPPDFMFELTKQEFSNLRSQFVTSSWGGARYLPFAFTEQGVAMLSSVLGSDKAIEMNIAIVRAFISLRQFALNYKELADQVEDIRRTVENHDEQLTRIYGAIENLMSEKEAEKEAWETRERIGFRKE
jgi:hypothetical protein